jgi:hypothetical protein
MVYINGYKFYEAPGSCGTCPFFNNGSTQMDPGSMRGHCVMWNEMHGRTTNPPRRCAKLFKKALTFPDGASLSIVGIPKEE